MCIQRCYGHTLVIWVTVAFLSAESSLAVLTSARQIGLENCCSLGNFSFFDHSLKHLEMVVWENSSRSEVSDMLKPTCLAPATMYHSESLKSHFIPIPVLGLNFSILSWPCLNALSYCHVIGWLHFFKKQYNRCTKKWLVTVYLKGNTEISNEWGNRIFN